MASVTSWDGSQLATKIASCMKECENKPCLLLRSPSSTNRGGLDAWGNATEIASLTSLLCD
eukprot:14399662-Heterocapsa_arctica.AAC.1